jgi:hypothetical protein
MAGLLLRNLWIHLYLLWLGGVLIALICDCLCRPQATQDSTPPPNAAKSPRPVFRLGRRPD